MTRPNPNQRVRQAKQAREIRDWKRLAARNREHRDKPTDQPEGTPAAQKPGTSGPAAPNPHSGSQTAPEAAREAHSE